ncbi:salicylate hydroxylase [Flammula alnicola]|nr:salicylate hydroxylase [Flammula alnicola]
MTTNETKNSERLRIAIIGAGIGGLTLSSALGILDREHSLDVNIYEGAAQISEIGAGINFWPRTWKIMKVLGLEQKLVQWLPQIPDDSERTVFQVRKSDQEEGIYIRDIKTKGGSVRFHRADLQQTLRSQISGTLHLSHRLISFEETEKEVRLYFLNGKIATCDLLIGMDGIKSVVRRGFLQKQGFLKSPSLDPVWSGSFAYRGLIPTEKLEGLFPGHRATSIPMLYVGKLKHLIVYPVSHDKLVNVVAFVTDPSKKGTHHDGPTTTTCEQEEVLAAFRGWETEVRALVQCIERPTKWAIRALIPLDRYASGRVILAGDAAHAMTPHQGAGAGQAVEDAYILASLLCHKLSTKANVPKISEIYNSVRCPEGNRVLEGSEISGMLSQLVAPGFEEVQEGDTEVPLEKLRDLYEVFSRQWDWAWKETAEDDRRRAIEMLESSEAF